jgi:hypothetical protein
MSLTGAISMNEPSKLLHDLDAQIVSLGERRDEAEKRRQKARLEIQSSDAEIEALETAIRGLIPLKSFYASASAKMVSVQPGERVEPGHNRRAIIEILSSHGSAMRVMHIAKFAHDNGKIKSVRGYDGVYATISTVLARNSKNIFVHLNNGRWDLRERRTQKIGVEQGIVRIHGDINPANIKIVN